MLTEIISRRILAYLIPLRIIKGHLPSDELLNRFPVLKDLYIPFISSIKSGDLAAYDRALDRSEHRLLELNLWLTLEKARELCMRSLFRRAYALLLPIYERNPEFLFRPQMDCHRQGHTGTTLDFLCLSKSLWNRHDRGGG
jgi:hypothetical protein